MYAIHIAGPYDYLLDVLKIECSKCCGLCCTALFFAKTDGFPTDKSAGQACENLDDKFNCKIHSSLNALGFKGCMSYDCFGAGQSVTQGTNACINKAANNLSQERIYKIFHEVFMLRQMLWYLHEASSLAPAQELLTDIGYLIDENRKAELCCLSGNCNCDFDEYRSRVNAVLKRASDMVVRVTGQAIAAKRTCDFIGKNFKMKNLDGADFSSALMIASRLEGCNLCGANFLGADVRDANVKNTDLSNCIFLTQGQVNSMCGNVRTKLPSMLTAPKQWGETEPNRT
ncbi:MAG: pentapeptide repeat-containing protein [Oscillospiraceae bacterium]